jgi:hypothetical protein
MPNRKPRPPKNADDPEQSRRFIETARELEAEHPAGDVDTILRKVACRENFTKEHTKEAARRRSRSRGTAE